MGTAIVKFKVMPTSPDTDLEKVKQEVTKTINEVTESDVNFEVVPIGFGLNALFASFAIDESKEIDPVEAKIRELEDVNSVEVADFRRALG